MLIIPLLIFLALQPGLMIYFAMVVSLVCSMTTYHLVFKIANFFTKRERDEKPTLVVDRDENKLIKEIEVNQKRAIKTEFLADETMADSTEGNKQMNKLILDFFQPRKWYHHRFAPDILLSIWAWLSLGVDSIYCQICHADVISARFRCGSILFCDECRFFLKKCPCESDVCEDGFKYDVSLIQ